MYSNSMDRSVQSIPMAEPPFYPIQPRKFWHRGRYSFELKATGPSLVQPAWDEANDKQAGKNRIIFSPKKLEI